jgi:hypothetical protein
MISKVHLKNALRQIRPAVDPTYTPEYVARMTSSRCIACALLIMVCLGPCLGGAHSSMDAQASYTSPVHITIKHHSEVAAA